MAIGQTNCTSCGERLTEQELAQEGYGPGNSILCQTCIRKAARQHRNGWVPVMQWEGRWDGLRLASTAPVPWTSSNVVIIGISKGGAVQAAHTIGGKLDLLEAADPSDMILVTWPGSRRQDAFIVDNRAGAKKALRQ